MLGIKESAFFYKSITTTLKGTKIEAPSFQLLGVRTFLARASLDRISLSGFLPTLNFNENKRNL